MDIEPEVMKVVTMLEAEEKEKLEIAYGVHINEHVLFLTCALLRRHSEAFIAGEDCRSDNYEVVLRNKAVELLEKACVRLRHDHDTNVEENGLDMDEYLTRRAFVELTEITKEKDHSSRLWIPRVEKECGGLRTKWEWFMSYWTQLQIWRQRSEVRNGELNMLQQLRQSLVSCLGEDVRKVDPFTGIIERLGSLVTQLLQTTHNSFKQNLSISPKMIVEEASRMTGVPALWLLQHSTLPLLDLGFETRLSERLIGQEHVILAITSALSKHKPGPHPLGSFLFLGWSGRGRTELAKAIAQHLFNDRDMFIGFDLSEYTDADSVAPLIGVHSSEREYCGGGHLMETVRRRPFGVIMFDNVEMAHASVLKILREILCQGMLIDGQGNRVDFTKTLIVMTSNVGCDKFRPWNCDCLLKVREFPYKQVLNRLPQQRKHKCPFLPLLREAESHFEPGFFEILDDVIVFGALSAQQFMAIVRLQLRDIASAITENKMVLYPSEAALRAITRSSNWMERGGVALRIWLQENLVPVLYDMLSKEEIDDKSTIYIDALVGTNELSYRLEKNGGLVEDNIYEQFKEFLRKLRIVYRKEKAQVDRLYSLRRSYYRLSTLLATKDGADLIYVSETLQQLVDITDDLITNACGNSMFSELEVAPVNLNEEAEFRQGERPEKMAKHGTEGLRTRLRSRLVGQQAIDIVSKTLLRSLKASHELPHRPAMCFLFLGLTSVGKADLAKGLVEHLVADDGTDLLIQINLSEYSSADSFSRLTSGPSKLTLCKENGLLEAVKGMPHHVIIFYEVEKAHISVFSALLSVLDHGVLSDNQGSAVDFRSSIIIFVSDIGDKEIISQLVAPGSQYSARNRDIEQGARGFRSELLNRVDEIVFFNPFVDEQLQKVARLPMRAGRHLEEGPCSAFPLSFHCLLSSCCDHALVLGKDPAVLHLCKGLISDDGRDNMVAKPNKVLKKS